jgi:hypothetical protein
MKTLTSILLPCLMLLCGEAARAQDGFDGVHCGADIAQALRGQHIPDAPSMTIESRHKDLGLANLGADELEKGWSLISWRICGDEYMVIADARAKVRDVLKLPPHSKARPESGGPCTKNGVTIPGGVVAILDKRDGADDLPATVAWKVDEKSGKFIPLPTAGLLCARSGIITVDGGM